MINKRPYWMAEKSLCETTKALPESLPPKLSLTASPLFLFSSLSSHHLGHHTTLEPVSIIQTKIKLSLISLDHPDPNNAIANIMGFC